MARPLRLQFEHALSHITSRGNARQAIVKTEAVRRAFLECLAQVVDRFGWRCDAYCLMNNGLLKKAASVALTLFPYSRTEGTLRPQKRLRSC